MAIVFVRVGGGLFLRLFAFQQRPSAHLEGREGGVDDAAAGSLLAMADQN